ncbi:hypothetical protein AGMMS49975_19440 [Clostridia bacterium]|nr:hypothetical protein AGMMS49975_19440 [Clostridia bacterium]
MTSIEAKKQYPNKYILMVVESYDDGGLPVGEVLCAYGDRVKRREFYEKRYRLPSLEYRLIMGKQIINKTFSPDIPIMEQLALMDDEAVWWISKSVSLSDNPNPRKGERETIAAIIWERQTTPLDNIPDDILANAISHTLLTDA